MIPVRRQADRSDVVTDGHMRLKVQLQLSGKAEVVDIETNETLFAHEVDGKMIALSEESQAHVDDLSNAAINRARIGKRIDET